MKKTSEPFHTKPTKDTKTIQKQNKKFSVWLRDLGVLCGLGVYPFAFLCDLCASAVQFPFVSLRVLRAFVNKPA